MRAPYGERGHMQTLRAVCVGSSCGVVGNLVRYGRNHANKAPSVQRETGTNDLHTHVTHQPYVSVCVCA